MIAKISSPYNLEGRRSRSNSLTEPRLLGNWIFRGSSREGFSWLAAFAVDPRVRLLTRVDGDAAGAIATVALVGRDPRPVAEELRREHGILVRAVVHPEFSGLRVTPNLHNSVADLERFVAALRGCLRA